MTTQSEYLKDTEVVSGVLKGMTAVQTLRNWRSKTPPQGPPFFKVGKHVFYLESQVREWLASQNIIPAGGQK